MKPQKSFFSFKFEETAPKKRTRPKRLRAGRRPELTIGQILEWADAQYARTGQWPKRVGWVYENPNEAWFNIDAALRLGLRGLPGQTTLAQLLAEHRGVRNRKGLPSLAVERILAWADAHRNATGDWPTNKSGPVAGSGGESWSIIDAALQAGIRGLPGGSSLPRLLAQYRGRRNPAACPALSVELILMWADAHFRRIGSWPSPDSGPIEGAVDENWFSINGALLGGHRGLPRGSSLARLLAQQRGKRERMNPPRLIVEQILAWADAHLGRTGSWPIHTSGAIAGAPGETWSAVHRALYVGSRGLPGGSSLARLLAKHRGRRNEKDLPRLTAERILAWADAHFQRAGRWPTTKSGPVEDAPHEGWLGIDAALNRGFRGLPGGTTLARLLAEQRGRRNHKSLPALSAPQILAWAKAHFRRTGHRPYRSSGPVEDAPGETWCAVDSALRAGFRGLPGGSSLARLLA